MNQLQTTTFNIFTLINTSNAAVHTVKMLNGNS